VEGFSWPAALAIFAAVASCRRFISGSDVFDVLGDAPLGGRRIRDLAVAVAPEHIFERHYDHRAHGYGAVVTESTSSVYRNINREGVTPGAGASAIPGNSSLTKMMESPIFSSACMILPSGTGHAHNFRRAKDRFIEFDGASRHFCR